MALLGDRQIIETDISLINDDVAAAGVGMCMSTGGSGAAMGNLAGKCKLSANPSGEKYAGMLLTTCVDIDTTQAHVNYWGDTVDVGNRVTLLRKGWAVTDKISGTPAAGDNAYLTTNGNYTPTISSTGGLVATPLAGRFEGKKDQAGYAKISVNL